MVDYSKWKDIEISDDEDDTHPNIDKHSLFKWRHEARLNRMKEFSEKKEQLNTNLNQTKAKLNELKEKSKQKGNDAKLKEEISQLEQKLTSLTKDEEEIKKQERLMPWNVDTISNDGWSKTVVNKPKARVDRSKLR
mgnify:CR=1 FL=1